MIERIAQDSAFNLNLEELKSVLEPKNYVGRSPHRLKNLFNEVESLYLEANKDIDVNCGTKSKLKVYLKA